MNYILHIFLTFFVTVGWLSNAYAQIPPCTPSQKAEYHKAKTILVHEPGSELNCAMLHPRAALFDEYFDISEAQKEHRAYKKST